MLATIYLFLPVFLSCTLVVATQLCGSLLQCLNWLWRCSTAAMMSYSVVHAHNSTVIMMGIGRCVNNCVYSDSIDKRCRRGQLRCYQNNNLGTKEHPGVPMSWRIHSLLSCLTRPVQHAIDINTFACWPELFHVQSAGMHDLDQSLYPKADSLSTPNREIGYPNLRQGGQDPDHLPMQRTSIARQHGSRLDDLRICNANTLSLFRIQ